MLVKEGEVGGFAPSSIHGPNGDPGTFETAVWRWAVTTFRPRSVLDIGCGEGHAVRYFTNSLLVSAVGIDGSRQALAQSVCPSLCHHHDFRSGPWLSDQTFDLVWSCEVFEHIDERFVSNIMETVITAAPRYILFTAALPFQRGYHHVNCRNSVYWLKHFSDIGFFLSPELTEDARRCSEGFFRNGLILSRGKDAKQSGIRQAWYISRAIWWPQSRRFMRKACGELVRERRLSFGRQPKDLEF